MENVEEEDKIDQAIQWEFQLWKQAEQARFRAELKKKENERMDQLRQLYQQQVTNLRTQKAQKMQVIEKLQQELQLNVSKTQAKLNDIIEQQQKVRANIAQTKQQLQQTIAQAQKQCDQQLSECEKILQTEQAKAEQAQAQAAFFQSEWQSCEKRRAAEEQQFYAFLHAQNTHGPMSILNELNQKRKRRDENATQLLQLKGDVQEVDTLLQEALQQVAFLC